MEIPMAVLHQGDDPTELPTGISDTDVYIVGNDGLAVVQVTNPTGGDLQLSLVPTLTVGGVAAAEVTLTVAAGTTCWLPPLPPAVYNDDSGNAHITADESLVFNGLRF